MKWKFVRRPSVVLRPSVASIISEVISIDFFQILVVASHGPYPRTFFNFLKIVFGFFMNIFFSFSLLTWDSMGAKISKRYSSHKSQVNVFKLFLNFLPIDPHKTTLGIFEILKIGILTNFIPLR